MVEEEQTDLDSVSHLDLNPVAETSNKSAGIVSSESDSSQSLNLIFRLDLPAEKYDYDKDPGDGSPEDEANQNFKTYNPAFSHISVGHSSPVVLVQDLKIKGKIYLISIGKNGKLLAWEMSEEGEIKNDAIIIGDL